jgi:hypothetical protein
MLALKYHRADAISTYRTALFASSHPAEAKDHDKGEKDETKCSKEYRREETHNVATRDIADSAAALYNNIAGKNSWDVAGLVPSNINICWDLEDSVVMNKARNTRTLKRISQCGT